MLPHVFEHLRRLPPRSGQPLQGRPADGADGLIQLADNGNPWGPADAVRDRVRMALAGRGLDDLRRYPPADGAALAQAIALRRGVDPGQVILGNGSTEVLGIAARAMLMDGGSGLAARHSFAAFGLATQAAGGRSIECHATALEVEAAHLLAAVQPDTRIVYLGHPNNPTGTLLERAALAQLVRSLRDDILLVVDQAYAEYVDPGDYPSALAHLADRKNLLVLHTFSKIHGLLERVRSPFNTNLLAQLAAETAVGQEAFEADCRARNLEARSAFLLEAERHRCRVSGQAGNFMLMETVFPARELVRDLLRQRVMVYSAEGDGLPNHVRVSLGTPQEMNGFWKAAGPILDNLGCGCS